MERLGPGSIFFINSFILEDQIYIPLRCKTPTKILILTRSDLERVLHGYKETEKAIQVYTNQLMRLDMKYPFDFILNIYKATQEEVKQLNDKNARFKGREPITIKELSDKINGVRKRNWIFKNCVMRKILEIRILKRKPKLGAVLAHFKK